MVREVRESREVKAERKRAERNAREIEKYLDAFDRIHRSAAGSEVPCGPETKGMRQYVAPISEGGFFLISDPGNQEAATLLSPVFVQMRREMYPYYYICGLVAGWYAPQREGVERERPPVGGVAERPPAEPAEEPAPGESEPSKQESKEKPESPKERRKRQNKRYKRLWSEATRVPRRGWEVREEAGTPSGEEGDHGFLRRMRAGETQDDRDALATFEAACRWAAKRLPEGVELSVYAPGGRVAKDNRQAAAMEREEKRQDQHARAHHIRYDLLRMIERENPEKSREAAKADWCEATGMRPSTIRDSIRFCERHEWPDGEPVVPGHRWEESGEGVA